MSDVLKDPREFRRRLLIDVDGAAVPLEKAIDDWQRIDFEHLDAGFQRAAGIKPTYGPVYQRAWLERPRGHSKTTDLAVMASWPLATSTRPLRAYWAAGDRDQGLLVINAFVLLCRQNPILGRLLDVGKNTITNRDTGSTLEVITSDSATSWGLLPDLVFVDELTHWRDGNGETLWHSLLSSVAKKSSAMLVTITNAGLGAGESWQWKASEAARESEGWYFSRLDGPRASWITPERLEEQRKFLPPAAFNRVWMNIWSTSAGDALEEADVRAAVKPGLTFPERPGVVLGVLDLGLRHDHSALVGIHVDMERQHITQVYAQTWVPPVGGEVEIAEVEMAIRQFVFEFAGCHVYADFWQAASTVQRLQRDGYSIEGLPSTPKNLNVWATHLVAAFRGRQISLLPNESMVAQLLRLRIIENPVGYRLQAPRDRKFGHCDLAIALSMAVGEAMEGLFQYRPALPPMPESVLDL